MHSISQLAAISPSLVSLNTVKDLGVVTDSELTFEKHCSKLSQTGFFHLCRLWAIRRSLTAPAMKTLVHAFVTSRLDFCNAILVGLDVRLYSSTLGLINYTVESMGV